MKPEAISPREYHRRREAERLRQREELRQRKLDEVRRAILHVAPRHPAVAAVYLFGSLLQPGRFQQGSDIDVAIDCDDLASEGRFWRALEEALRTNVDLRPRQGAVARAVAEEGELVYERAVPGPRAPD